MIGYHPFLDNLELECLHGLLEVVEGLGMYVPQFFEGTEVSIQGEGAASEIIGKVLHAPGGSLHLK